MLPEKIFQRKRYLYILLYLNIKGSKKWKWRVEMRISWVERYRRWNFYIWNLKNKSK